MARLGGGQGSYNLAQIAKGAILPPPQIIPGLLFSRSITMITAPPHSGKSMLLAHMAVSLDTGLPFLGKWSPTGPQRVLCIFQDAPDWDYAEQFRKIMRGMRIDADAAEDMVTRLILSEDHSLVSKEFQESLLEEFHEAPFDVLMLDSLIDFHGLDENSAQQMGYVKKALKWIRRTMGCAVVVTHHVRKAQEGRMDAGNDAARGSGVTTGGIDFHYVMRRQGQRVVMQMPKARGGDAQLIQYDMAEVDHPDGPAFTLITPGAMNTMLGRLHTFLAEPRRRAEVEAWYRAGGKTTAQAKRQADNDLRLLLVNDKVTRPGHGIWQAKGEPPV